jgi:hypothetical protein
MLLPAGRRSDVTEFPVTVVDAGPMVRATLLLPGCPPERALAAGRTVLVTSPRATVARS